MAIVDNLGTDDEESQLLAKTKPSDISSNAPSVSSGSDSGGSASATSTQVPGTVGASTGGSQVTTAANNAATPKNGGLVDLNQYLDANQPQVNQLSGKVGTWIQGQGKSANDAINNGYNAFASDVNNNTVNLDQNLVNRATKDSTNFVGNSTKDNPNADVQSFWNQENATYKGPTQYEASQYYAPVSNQVKQATEYGNDINSASGRTAILQAMNTGKLYNAGQAALDQSLLGSTPTSTNILQQGAASTSGLNQALSDSATKANALAKQAGLTTQQTAAAVQKAVSDTYNQFTTGIQGKVGTAQQAALTNQTALQNKLQSGQQLSPAELQALGMTQQQYQDVLNKNNQYNSQYGGATNLSQYFTPQTDLSGKITANNVATNADYAQQNALDVLGQNNNQFINTPNMAGTAPGTVGSFDYQNAAKTTQDRLDAAANNKALQANSGQKVKKDTLGQVIGVISTIATVASASSDSRLKDNIKFIGFDNRIPMFKFNYKMDPSTSYIGTMAQCVLSIKPEAVTKSEGFYQVDYDMLGARFYKVDDSVLREYMFNIGKDMFPEANERKIHTAIDKILIANPDADKDWVDNLLPIVKEQVKTISFKRMLVNELKRQGKTRGYKKIKGQIVWHDEGKK